MTRLLTLLAPLGPSGWNPSRRSRRRSPAALGWVLAALAGLVLAAQPAAATASIVISAPSGTTVDQNSTTFFAAGVTGSPAPNCYTGYPTAPLTPPCNWTWTLSGGGYTTSQPATPTGSSTNFLSQFTAGTFTLTVSRYGLPSASIPVTVRPMAISLSGLRQLPQGEPWRFTATLSGIQPGGLANLGVTWSLSSGGGTLSPDPTCWTCTSQTATVIAGTTPGNYALTAQSVQEPAVSGSLLLTVLPPPVTSISPTTAMIAPPQQVTFTATATNTSDNNFIFTTDDPAGDVNQGGSNTGTFLHDATKPGGQFHVRVVNEHGGTPAIATVNVVVVSLSPNPITVVPGTSRQFLAEVTGSQQALAWSTTVPGASISSGGRLQVAAGTAAGSYTVKAQTVGTPTATATATATIASSIPVTGVAVSPARSVIDSGQQEHLYATVQGQAGEPNPNQGVTWSATGPATVTVGADGLFTAPTVPGVYTVTATSQANPAKSGTATITVGEDLMVLPSWASVSPGAAVSFQAQVTGVAHPAVAWSVEEGAAGGGVSTDGSYTTPATSGVYHVLAVSTASGQAVQGMATVVVGADPQISVQVTPAETTLTPGAVLQFQATVAGSPDTAVVWSASDGGIDPAGVYTASPYYGTATITATSHADSTVQGHATVVVFDAGAGQDLQYDANGNLLSDGLRTFEWDAENRLTAIEIGTHRSEFAYDGFGRRVLITERDQGQVTSSRRYVWAADQIVEETDALSASQAVPPSSSGAFESADCNQLAGWAWDSSQPAVPLSVDVYDGATKLSTVLDNVYRADLQASAVGGGAHGFTLPTPAALKTGAAHTVEVRLAGTATSLGSRSVTCAAPAFGGSLDSANCTEIDGWGWDSSQPNSPIAIDVYDGATRVTTVVANVFRQDLLNAGIGNGSHGFSLRLPPAFKTGGAHTVTLKAAGTATQIGLAKSVTCTAATFGGSLDMVACNTILGWAWDANQPNTVIDVDLFDGGVLLATVPANDFRQDLSNAGIGNGVHGFAYTPPFAVSSSHTVTARPSGSSLSLSGTPKSAACGSETVLTQFLPSGMVAGGTKYYYSFDHLGSVREVTDRNGNVISRYDYDPFGRLTINQGTAPRFGYAGYFYHAPSGLYLTKFRAYDPDLARWESRDPRQDSVTAGAYQYSADDPINLYDPAGAAPIPAPPPTWPKPPGWDPHWTWRYPEGTSPAQPRWFDPSGGEWRWHPVDKWHPDPHWDNNPWDGWNSPWGNVPPDPNCPVPPPAPTPVPDPEVTPPPWWRQIPDWFPEPVPVVINPCFFMPWFCGIGSGSVGG